MTNSIRTKKTREEIKLGKKGVIIEGENHKIISIIDKNHSDMELRKMALNIIFIQFDNKINMLDEKEKSCSISSAPFPLFLKTSIRVEHLIEMSGIQSRVFTTAIHN